MAPERLLGTLREAEATPNLDSAQGAYLLLGPSAEQFVQTQENPAWGHPLNVKKAQMIQGMVHSIWKKRLWWDQGPGSFQSTEKVLFCALAPARLLYVILQTVRYTNTCCVFFCMYDTLHI